MSKTIDKVHNLKYIDPLDTMFFFLSWNLKINFMSRNGDII